MNFSPYKCRPTPVDFCVVPALARPELLRQNEACILYLDHSMIKENSYWVAKALNNYPGISIMPVIVHAIHEEVRSVKKPTGKDFGILAAN